MNTPMSKEQRYYLKNRDAILEKKDELKLQQIN